MPVESFPGKPVSENRVGWTDGDGDGDASPTALLGGSCGGSRLAPLTGCDDFLVLAEACGA